MLRTGFDAAARGMIDPAKITWVVVGDKAVVLPQLKDLGLPVEVVEGDGSSPAAKPAGAAK